MQKSRPRGRDSTRLTDEGCRYIQVDSPPDASANSFLGHRTRSITQDVPVTIPTASLSIAEALGTSWATGKRPNPCQYYSKAPPPLRSVSAFGGILSQDTLAVSVGQTKRLHPPEPMVRPPCDAWLLTAACLHDIIKARMCSPSPPWLLSSTHNRQPPIDLIPDASTRSIDSGCG